MLTRIFSHIFLFVIFDAPLVQPVDVNFVAVEAEGQPYIVGNGGIVHIVCIQTVVSLIFFSPVAAENTLKGSRVLFIFQIHELREPAVGAGNVEVLFTRHLKYGRDLRMEGGMARIVHMGIALNRVGAMPGICDGCLRGVRKITGGSGGQEVMFAFSLKMSGSFPYEGRLGVGKSKRLIFRYDRKIPDYFSVAGAP